MKKLATTLILFIFFLAFQTTYATTTVYQVKEQDICSGYIIEKIWLDEYAHPKVGLSGISYSENVTIPADVKTGDPNKFQMVLGMERKKPFIVVRIPAYVAGSQAGLANRVSSFTLTITETPKANKRIAAKTTDVASSVLSSGKWYKIGITKTGFYKIDNNFIAGLGLNPASVNPGDLQVFGNGGHMLSESNVSRPTDLIENAILVNDNGDAKFDNGEYAIFYGVGPTNWLEDTANHAGGFKHQKNIYTDSAYYFITFDKGAGLRIAGQAPMAAGNVNVTSFNFYDVHDTDGISPIQFGKTWYGEPFYPQSGATTQTFRFNTGPTVSPVDCKVAFGSTSGNAGSTVSLTLNNTPIASQILSKTVAEGIVMEYDVLHGLATSNAQTVDVGVTLNPIDGNSTGYLDYIEINARRQLIMTDDQLSFRDLQSRGAGNLANYMLAGANGKTKVWDITDPQHPVLMNGSLSGDTYSFVQDATTLHEFAAMNSENVYTPKYVGSVYNQNLHGYGQADLIIVAHPDFRAQAKELADYHTQHDGLRVIVVTPSEIYNEFSSGGQDISAIRDFARMFYKRAGADVSQMPRYLLLFGSASYDYKHRLANNSNFVPVFESAESWNNDNCFSTDDFFGFLDDSEDITNYNVANTLDIGVGRLPARSVDDAKSLVNKIINYSSPASLGPWRLSTTYVADDSDGAGNHMSNAQASAAVLAASSKGLYNQAKVYLEAIPIIQTPASYRSPNANASINNDVFKGTFMINYSGHGNPEVWADERILTQDDFNTWRNPAKLPLMVTATCDFGQFDHPQYVSAAEKLVNLNGGGAIALLTTTGPVFSTYNQDLNTQYVNAQFSRNADNTWNTFGEAYRTGKNVTYNSISGPDKLINFYKFSLLGDPAVTPDFPQYNIQLDSLIDGVTLEHADTVKALGAYKLNGSVRNADGSILRDFNGLVSVSFFDKPKTIVGLKAPYQKFQLQDNIIYKGRATVTNGLFSVSFITPKDINYYYGTGKTSLYADNGSTDAAGADTSLKIGGFSDHPQYNTNPPIVKPYINDSLFLNGGITGNNTSLFVSLFTETGINVSGNNVGHDLTAVLDENIEVPYILNDYYETAPNTYQKGYVSFPLEGLSDGRHTITVRAWDVNNNRGEGKVDFMVADGKAMVIQNLLNYPNPFANNTHFVFEHNHPDEELDVQIGIFNTAGALVKSIKETFRPTGSRSNEIMWDGSDDNGNKLPSGVYVYRLNITSEKGFISSAYQKLVIVR